MLIPGLLPVNTPQPNINAHATHDCLHGVTTLFIFSKVASSARETPHKSKSRLQRPFQLVYAFQLKFSDGCASAKAK